jgi:hypothetical protein
MFEGNFTGGNMTKNRFANIAKVAARSTLILTIAALGGTAEVQQAAVGPDPQETMTTSAAAFHCNMNALSAGERRSHKRLTQKLIAMRTQIVETEKGYEFQFVPTAVSIGELAAWTVAESKCCPFFDFHIDLEQRGTLACLRLTGAQGIKPFIREEFRVPWR